MRFRSGIRRSLFARLEKDLPAQPAWFNINLDGIADMRAMRVSQQTVRSALAP